MEQDVWRAQHYALLATLLAAPPAQSLLENIAAVEISDPESEMGRAWLQLKQAAGAAEAGALKQEFDDLFIGLTQGEVIPYGSYYQTGFLHEKPLAKLRQDLALLGLGRQQDRKEPEDHIAAECDVMRLILTAQGTPVVDASTFFSRHISPWANQFFDDLAKADSASFYRRLAHFGAVFMQSEMQTMK